eukprot:2065437-Pyramimonas_sp.AAC.1
MDSIFPDIGMETNLLACRATRPKRSHTRVRAIINRRTRGKKSALARPVEVSKTPLGNHPQMKGDLGTNPKEPKIFSSEAPLFFTDA